MSFIYSSLFAFLILLSLLFFWYSLLFSLFILFPSLIFFPVLIYSFSSLSSSLTLSNSLLFHTLLSSFLSSPSFSFTSLQPVVSSFFATSIISFFSPCFFLSFFLSFFASSCIYSSFYCFLYRFIFLLLSSYFFFRRWGCGQHAVRYERVHTCLSKFGKWAKMKWNIIKVKQNKRQYIINFLFYIVKIFW